MNESAANRGSGAIIGSARSRESAGVWLALVTPVVLLIFLCLSGVSLLDSIRLLIVIAVQSFAGWYAWLRVRRGGAGSLELMGMALALGTASSALAGLLVRDVFNVSWGWVVPALAVGAWALIARLRNHGPTRHWKFARDSGRDVLMATAALLLGVLSLVPNIANYPLKFATTWSRYHPDMVFFEALSNSIARLGSADSIFLSGERIHYHWLVYAWAGQTSTAADAEPFVVLTRLLPFIALVSTVFLVMAWARQLTQAAWAPTLAAVLIISGGYLGATNGTILNFDSPSQALATSWLLAFIISGLAFMGTVARPGAFTRINVALGFLLLMLAVCIAGGKISSAGVLILSTSFLTLLGFLRRAEWKWRAALVLAATVAGTTAVYVQIIFGSADPGGLKIGSLVNKASSLQGLNPLLGSRGVIAGTLLLLLAISIRWAGLVWLGVDSSERWKISTIWGFGLALAGGVSLLLLSGGLNDTWFALGASAPLCVLSAVGACMAGQKLVALSRTQRVYLPVALAFVGAGVVFVGTYFLWSTGASGGNVWVSTLRWAGPIYGVAVAVVLGLGIGQLARRGHRLLSSLAAFVVILTLAATPARAFGVLPGSAVNPGVNNTLESPQFELKGGIDPELRSVIEPEELVAAAWLRHNARNLDLLATNITNSPLVPALTGMPTYVSGMHYQAPYGSVAGLETLLARERATYAFIDSPSAGTVEPLCEADVRWLWVDPEKTGKREWAPWADIALSDAQVIILKLNKATCVPAK